jgi:pentatricopeptide repeat protein
MIVHPADAWLAHMRSGRFEEAWRVSDEMQRRRRGVDCRAWPRHLQFVWDGRPLEGRRVLVRCYHGLGDTVQYVRLLPRLREVAAEVILWVQPKLIPLLRSMRGFDRILPLHDGVPQASYDVDIELAELMHALRISLDTLPREVPYLHPPPIPKSSDDRSELIVGIVWRAGSWDARRSIPCDLLAPLGAVPGVAWRVFQHGPAREEWCHEFGSFHVSDDIVGEAQELRELDLLVSVDTFAAHFAGALAVPVWTLLPALADWRWMERRSDTPWYPGMRLFRQTHDDDWSPVIASIGAELQRLASTRRAAVVRAEPMSGMANAQ